MTLAFLRLHCHPQSSPLCGNSIGQDRRFLCKYMPALNGFFHYRNIDVSTLKELVHRWYPSSNQAPEKKKTHYVLDDIRESIEELVIELPEDRGVILRSGIVLLPDFVVRPGPDDRVGRRGGHEPVRVGRRNEK